MPAMLRAAISEFGGKAGKGLLGVFNTAKSSSRTLAGKTNLSSVGRTAKATGRTAAGSLRSLSAGQLNVGMRAAGFGAGASYGYATSEGTSGMQTFERTIGMGFLGAIGGAIGGKMFNPATRAGVRSAASKFKGTIGTYEVGGSAATGFSHGYKGVFKRSTYATREIGGGQVQHYGHLTQPAPFMAGRGAAFKQGMAELDKVGLAPKFGYKQAVLAGGLYGAIDEDESVFSGAAVGLSARFLGGRARNVAKKTRGAWGSQNTLREKIGATPFTRIGLTGGAGLGLYSNFGEEDSALGGAIKGGIVGGTLGAIGSAAAYSPMGTLMGAGAVGVAGMGAMEGGMYTAASNVLDADGDLALALHKTRHHGF